MFKAFARTPLERVRVVIVGQDPYPKPGQADGLCFSVRQGMPVPRSLKNIFRAIKRDIADAQLDHGCLESWARQGVLLLNSVLSVAQGDSGSHQGQGWEQFTDRVIELINTEREHVVFMLWGRCAQEKGKNIDKNKHCVLMAPHPAHRGPREDFVGCGHFRTANKYLKRHDLGAIDWSVRKQPCRTL